MIVPLRLMSIPVLVLAAGVLPVQPLAGQETPGAPAPSPRPHEAMDSLVAALNDPATSLEAYAAKAFTTRALATESADQRARLFVDLRGGSGVEIVDRGTTDGRMAEAVVRQKRGGRFARIVLFTGRDEPGRIAQLFVLAARDPAKVSADKFPLDPVAPASIPTEIIRRIDSLTGDDLFSGVVLVARGNEVLVHEARGMAEQSWRIPNRIDTRFNIASIGKMFTAAAVMALVEQGRLSLDDTVAQRVPTFPHREAAAKITLRHLLQHKGGLAEWDGRRPSLATTAEAVASMTEAPVGEPGARVFYSNAGYVLLAAAIERATGLSFSEALAKLVFEPAGMTATGLWPVTGIVPNRATGYLRPASDPLAVGPRFSNAQYLGWGGDGSGGAYATALDLFRFHRALATGRLVRDATLRAMIGEAHDFPGTPRPSRYGLGLRLESCAGVPTLGHSGGGQNSGTDNATFASLDGKWTIVVLTNYDPPAADGLSFALCEFVHRQ